MKRDKQRQQPPKQQPKTSSSLPRTLDDRALATVAGGSLNGVSLNGETP
jgi:hypothetical protein